MRRGRSAPAEERAEASEAKLSGRGEQWLCERWLDDHGEDCVRWVTSTQIWIARGYLTAVAAVCKGQNTRWEKIFYRNGGK